MNNVVDAVMDSKEVVVMDSINNKEVDLNLEEISNLETPRLAKTTGIHPLALQLLPRTIGTHLLQRLLLLVMLRTIGIQLLLLLQPQTIGILHLLLQTINQHHLHPQLVGMLLFQLPKQQTNGTANQQLLHNHLELQLPGLIKVKPVHL